MCPCESTEKRGDMEGERRKAIRAVAQDTWANPNSLELT